MHIRNRMNFAAGVLYVAIGGAFAIGALGLPLGTPARMGPGYFPMIVSSLLVLIGLAVAAFALRPAASETHLEGWDLRRLALILGAVVAFALLLTSAGLVVAIAAITMISSLASEDFDWRVALANTVFLAIAGSAIFVYGLGLLFPLWPPFLAG